MSDQNSGLILRPDPACLSLRPGRPSGCRPPRCPEGSAAGSGKRGGHRARPCGLPFGDGAASPCRGRFRGELPCGGPARRRG
ncbi:MAG: hypothetical protein IK116_05140 [Firmicutes bacterium]|nr:hypothetical protein [Bacillota bacterium]